MKETLFKVLQKLRYQYCGKLLKPGRYSLLDVGCMAGDFVRLAISKGYEATGIDIENDVATTRFRADIVTCFEVLEHLPDPVKAIKNLKSMYHKQLIISIPHEPWFSLWRLSWEREHLWAITPAALKIYLGDPVFERNIILGRYYVAVWEKNDAAH